MKDLAAPLVPKAWGLQALVHVCSGLPRGEAPPCLPTTSSSSPLAAFLHGRGHLKATSGQSVTSLPPHELPSLGALVPTDGSAQLSIPSGCQGGFVVRGDLEHALNRLLYAF